ncbi:MAG: hypothetical protein LC792_08360 [Actinobacteria bacterium]|nr:hypothetical protein [Actinomycetota bacterium]
MISSVFSRLLAGETGGRRRPALDLGDVLRVPGPAIEQMLGTGLGAPRPQTGNQVEARPPVPAVPATPPAPHDEPPAQPVIEPAGGGTTENSSPRPIRWPASDGRLREE